MSFSKILQEISRPISLILALLVFVSCLGCTAADIGDILDLAGDVIEIFGDTTAPDTLTEPDTTAPDIAQAIDEDGSYCSKDDVALYIHTYGKLPKNFITKSEAEKLGWEGGSVERYAKGCAIGGDRFGNREGQLPKKNGRYYTECDIDTLGKSSRGSKRIVFSNDGLIYYTDDHYETFTLLYGEE